MADALFDSVLGIAQLAVTLLIYAGIIINILTRKGTDQLLFVISLVGYFAILYLINDFFLATTFIAMWFTLFAENDMVPRYILIGVYAVMLFLGYSNPIFYILALALYTVSIANFVFGSFRRVNISAKI